MFVTIFRNKIKLLLIGGSNQAISSLTTFFLNFYLLSIFKPDDYGFYGIGFATILFIAAIVDAILFTQMVIIYPTIEEKKRKDFISKTFNLLIIFCFFIIVLTFFVLIANVSLFGEKYFSNSYVFIITISAISFIVKEFLVRVSYNNRKEVIAIYIHFSIFLITLLVYLSFHVLNIKIDVFIAFSIFSISHFIGIITGLSILKIKPISYFFYKELTSSFYQFWLHGKWACLTNFTLMLRIHAYTIIAIILFNVAAVGNLNAARVFITPALIIIPVIVQLSMPRLSTLREKNIEELFKIGNLITWLFLSVAIIYSLILIFSYDIISNYLLTESYQNLQNLVVLWSLYAILLAVRNGQLLITQVLQKFKNLSFIYIISSVITIIASYVLGNIWNLTGIIMGLILGEVYIIIMLLNLINKEKKINYVK